MTHIKKGLKFYINYGTLDSKIKPAQVNKNVCDFSLFFLTFSPGPKESLTILGGTKNTVENGPQCLYLILNTQETSHFY